MITFLILANLAILACWQIGKDQLKEVRLRAVITYFILANLAILALAEGSYLIILVWLDDGTLRN